MATFIKVLTDLNPSVFFVQESKLKEEGKLNFNNYVLFEMIRKNREGGGLLLGCIKELKPVLVRRGSDDVEAMSIDIFVKAMKIRCVVAYGCQENNLLERKQQFWKFIEEEAICAQNSGSGFIMQFDGNLWVGPKIVPGDPRPQNKNGKLFEEFLGRQKQLTVVNSLPICEGLVTRVRIKDGKEEKSVLDFFVVCSRVLPYVTEMKIDENKKHTLTNYKPAIKGKRANDTDHFTKVLDVELEVVPDKPIRREVFNFKDKQAQSIFTEKTSKTDEFSKCFQNSSSLIQQVNAWRNVLNDYCKMSFKKIRIDTKKKIKCQNPKLVSLINKRNKLVKERVECKKCEKKFRRLSQMSTHMWMDHMVKDDFECDICGENSQNERALKTHMKLEHDNEVELNCQICDEELTTQVQMNIHMKNHNIENIENEIANIEAEEKRNFIFKKFKRFSENPENVNLQEVWKVLKSLGP